MRAESLWHSFRYAFAGIRYVLTTQRNAKIHLLAAVLVSGLMLLLSLPLGEMAVLVLTMAVVLAAEMMNTALEAVVDLSSPELHPLARIAKDAAAGAVLMLSLAAVVIGLLLLGPPLWQFVQ